ncbi:MAG TPA: PhoPQ-activated pathogenicity-like protein PqaA type [Bacteroidales bacterium]|nr:PhoPQ-activated pathogenicity-like protein PqaA type [Bacteroidales bacterium]HBZ20937.1 PhoPQ-activated pathogenicity-like protein PqaA type [Bacteroidales bacterium]
MKKLLFNVLLTISVLTVLSCSHTPVNPETALQAYLQNSDKSFKWEVQEKQNSEGAVLYRIIFTSQTWRNIEWNHELMIIVPDSLKFSDALLFITGGSVKDGKPDTHEFTDDFVKAIGNIALINKSVAAIIWQVPNQPLYNDLTEDALITYTLYNYKQDKDFTWPLLFPMTKSAVRAMDVIQEFTRREAGKKVDYFVLSGASKRGWTTWLAGASDKRVKAICPMVIDVLNMPANIRYQKEVWGDYSIEIEDYVKLGIVQDLASADGNDLVKMIDPYSYRKALTMPKMIFMATNDPYWPVDAVKNYIDSIPGDNHICYTPNAGHNLGNKVKALTTLSAFFGITAINGNYPDCNYEITESEGTITLTVRSEPGQITDADLWIADSDDLDFRDEEWLESDPEKTGNKETTASIRFPESGYLAFYVDLKHKSVSGTEYTQSTRMFVADTARLRLK